MINILYIVFLVFSNIGGWIENKVGKWKRGNENVKIYLGVMIEKNN